ncbi:hypothetical protein ACFWPK_27605 [Nocardia sp. NPDC058519]|uniref:hypothetical protein n=1 Tax=Nocardia sp. NPDC058519 TaxID=3346535 RepID=UPI003663150C
MRHFSGKSVARYTAACMIAVGIGGCSADPGDEISHLSTCAEISFPEDADVVWYQHDTRFRESTSAAVVDIPIGSFGEFKRLSGFAEFAPGAPSSWKPYWAATGMNDPLTTDAGNEHSVEGYRDPRRYVVIHDGGNEKLRIFVHTDC